MELLEGESERVRHKKDGESAVSRGLVGAELCALGHQKQEGREKTPENTGKI